MFKFKFSKLVRDKIVDIQIASGAKANFRQLNSDEHKHELVKKIVEEAQEIIKANPEEIAFKKGLYVDYIEMDENHPWFGYYRKNADRYPEIK